MPDIKDLLDRIIEERGEKAQAQLEKKQRMEKRRDKLKALEGMDGAFQKLTKEEKKLLVSSERSMEILDNNVQMLKDCIEAYDAAVRSLDSIAQRYQRHTINLSVIGKTGAGKSSFLKSASGLGNECIPAYSGESCTGVTSIIENCDIEGTRACLTFKTEEDVLGDFNREVRTACSQLFPGSTRGTEFYASRLDKKAMENIVNRLETEDNKVPAKEIRIFLDKWEEWYGYIGQKETVIDDTAEIEKFISKHDEKNENQYFRYIAVKKAVIQTKFHEIIDARIRLLDTVGIGDGAADTQLRMEEAIENESDGVIFMVKDGDHRFGGPLDSNSQVLPKLQDIYNQQSDKAAAFWIAFGINAPLGEEHARQYFRFLKQDRADGGYGGEGMLGPGHIRFQQVIDVTKPAQVKDMVNAFLRQISDNLSDVDAHLEEKSISLCQKAMELENTLRGNLKQVSINSAAQQERNMIFGFMKSGKEILVKSLMALKMPEEGDDLLKERLGFVRDLAEERDNSMLDKDESLDAIIAACCDKDIVGEGYRRLAAYEKLNEVVRKIGTLSPAHHKVSEEAFREDVAKCVMDFLGKDPDSAAGLKAPDNVVLSGKSRHFFRELADILFKDIDDSEDMKKAFCALDELQRNDVDGISKAIFNNVSFKYLNTLSADGLQPYTDIRRTPDAEAAAEPEDKQAGGNLFAFGSWNSTANTAHASGDGNPAKDRDACFKKKLKQEMKSWLGEIVSRLERLVEANEREQFLIKGTEQMEAEVYNFLLVFSQKYDAKWLMVFQNLYERGMILQGKGKKIRSLSEAAQKTKSYIQAFSSLENV